MKLNIKKGDTVKVIAGDDKGKQGLVLSVSPKELKAVVEGLNIVTRHLKPSAGNPQGSIVKKEAPLQVSNLQLVDKSGNTSRVGRKLNTSGKLQRYSKKTGEFID